MALIGEVSAEGVKDGEEDAVESGDVGDGLGRWVVMFVVAGRLEHLEINCQRTQLRTEEGEGLVLRL